MTTGTSVPLAVSRSHRLITRSRTPALVFVTAVLLYAAFKRGGVYPADWYIVTFALSLVALAILTRSAAPTPSRWLLRPLLLLPAYAAFQLLPLPAWVLRFLSPERAQQLEQAGIQSGPLSVSPTNTLYYFLVLTACALMVLIARDLAWRSAVQRSCSTPSLSRPSFASLLRAHGLPLTSPLILLAALEALLGLAQHYTDPSAPARGTFVNRNHFAGLLEMALPFPLMYAVTVFRRSQTRFETPLRPALMACAALSLTALILLGIIHSLSRMGFTAAVLAVFVCAGGAMLRAHGRWRRGYGSTQRRWGIPLTAALLVAASLFVFLPPDQLIARFGDIRLTDGITSEDRLRIWRESVPLIGAYPLFGCGLGGFESAFSRFKTVAPMNRVDFAHNDYLQCAIELGLIGLLLTVSLLVAILGHVIRVLAESELAIACLASFAAILLHSTADFNLYFPINALVLAWISGISVSLVFSSHLPHTTHLSRGDRSRTSRG